MSRDYDYEITTSPIPVMRDYDCMYTVSKCDELISPISHISTSHLSIEYFERERKARKRLRQLLDEQAELNDGLIDENEILNIQQKHLLQLLITKDKQLESLTASLMSTSLDNTLPVHSETTSTFTQTQSPELLCSLFQRRISNALEAIRRYSEEMRCADIIQQFQNQGISAGVALLNTIAKRNKQEMMRQGLSRLFTKVSRQKGFEESHMKSRYLFQSNESAVKMLHYSVLQIRFRKMSNAMMKIISKGCSNFIKDNLNAYEKSVNSCEEMKLKLKKAEQLMSTKDKQISILESHKNKLQQDNEKLESELQTKEQQLSYLESEYEAFLKDHKSLENELKNTMSAMKLLEDHKIKLEVSAERIKKDLQDKSDALKKAETDLQVFKREHHSISYNMNEKEAQIKQLEHDRKIADNLSLELEEKLKEREEYITEMSDKIDNLEAELKAARSEVEYKEELMKELENEFMKMKQGYSKIENDLRNKDDIIEQLEKEFLNLQPVHNQSEQSMQEELITLLQEEKRKLTEEVSQYKLELQRKDKAIESLKNEESQNLKELSRIQEDFSHQQEIITELERAIQMQTESLKEMDCNIDTNKLTIRELEVAKYDLERDKQRLEKELRIKESYIKSHEEESYSLKQQVRRLEEELEYKAGVFKKLEQERQAYQQDTSQYEREISIKENLIREFEQEIRSLKNEISQRAEETANLKQTHSQMQTALKKAKEMQTSILNERAQISNQENEMRKQLISMTSTIDSLAEEKEQLLEKLGQAAEDITQLRDQITQQVEINQSLSGKNNIYLQRETELKSHIHELERKFEREIQNLEMVLKSKESELKKTLERESELRNHLENQKKDLESRASAQDREKLKKLMRENAQLVAQLEELAQDSLSSKNTNSQLSSQVLKLNREIADLRHELRDTKDALNKSKLESRSYASNFEATQSTIQVIQRERDELLSKLKQIQMSQSQTSQNTALLQSLKEHCFKLEQQLQNAQETIAAYRHLETDAGTLNAEKMRLEHELAEVNAELEECRQEALSSRTEVNRVCEEIENYARILEAMESKVIEAEERARAAEKARDDAIADVHMVRQRYISMISGSNK